MRGKLIAAAASVAAAAALTAGAAAGSGGPSAAAASSGAKSVTISSAKVGHFGRVLVDEHGHVLYMFSPDKHSKVTCKADCQSVWPAVAAPAKGSAKAKSPVKQSKIGSDPNPTGGRIVTYNGWPLYTYVTDTTAGEASGQGISLNGGHWYVIAAASGKPVTHK